MALCWRRRANPNPAPNFGSEKPQSFSGSGKPGCFSSVASCESGAVQFCLPQSRLLFKVGLCGFTDGTFQKVT